MKFKYLGEPEYDAPEVSTHFGIEFYRGQFVDVSDEFVIAKLLGHPHFVAQDEGDAKAGDNPDDAGKPAVKPKKRARKKAKSGGMNANNSRTNRTGDEADRGA